MALLRWQQNIVDEEGNVLPSAEVEIRDEVSGSLVNLFEDIDGVTPKGNPLTVDSDGYGFAYMEPGRFKITATSADQSFTKSWRDVRLANDFSDLDDRINQRVIYVGSVAELEAMSLEAGVSVRLIEEGKEGDGTVKSGTPPSDPQKGIYIVLANGNYWERDLEYNCLYANWFGGVGDGVDTGTEFTGTDNTAAWQAADDMASSLGYSLTARPGKYRFAPNTVNDTGTLTLNGSRHIWVGKDVELLIDDDAPTTYSLLDFIRTANLGSSTNLDDRELLHISGMKIRGRWSHSNTYAGPNFLNVENFARIQLFDVSAYDLRAKFSRSRYNGSLVVDNFEARRIASDCLRFVDTPDVRMSNLRLTEIDDDCIALPVSSAALADPRQKITITNVNMTKCEGILVLGARNVSISNVTTRLCHGTQIYVGGNVGNESDLTPFSVALSGIHIVDPLNRAGDGSNGVPATFLANSLSGAIVVAGIAPTAATTGARPEYWDGVAGGIVVPYNNDDSGNPIFYNYDGDTKTIAGGYNYSVSNFSVTRTLPDVANYSDWGFGLAFNRFGFFDPAVNSSHYADHGVQLVGSIKGATVGNGSVMGLKNGAAVWLLSTAADDQEREREFEAVTIHNVTGRDVKYGVAHSAIAAADSFTWDVEVADCTFDCDPFALSSRRTSPIDGSWQDTATVADQVAGIMLRQSRGWRVYNNSFANCYVPVLGDSNIFEQADFSDNLIRCSPSALGYSASNLGIATIIESGKAFRLVHVFSDPTDGQFMRVVNHCLNQASAKPSSGRYIRGHFVENTNPSIAASQVLLGWLRLTTGNNHVLDTDWAACYAATS